MINIIREHSGWTDEVSYTQDILFTTADFTKIHYDLITSVQIQTIERLRK